MSARDLQEALECYFQERAAILQFDAGYPRQKAESLARAEVESWRKARETAAKDAEVCK